MKFNKLLYILFAITCTFSIHLSGVQGQSSKNSTTLGWGKIYPQNDSSKQAEFNKFYKSLLSAVQQRDTNFILSTVDISTISSFGDGPGKEAFINKWDLNKAEFWNTFEKTLLLGSVFNKQENSFVFPYIYSLFPETLDGFMYAVVIKKEAKVYTRPDSNSKLLEKLSYDIIEVLGNIKGDENGWTHIALKSGEKGYISANDIRSPLSYRVGFTFKDSKWIMEYFVAGD